MSTEPTGIRQRKRGVALAIGGLALIALATGVGVAWGGGNEQTELDVAVASTTTLQATTTSAPSPTTGVSTTAVEVDTSSAVWPYRESSARYATPEDAARTFATDFLGFLNPRMAAFTQGDNRSGEINVTTRDNGPATTVIVRQLADGNWWVLGASSANIQVTQPTALAVISSPVQLSGTSTAYEGTVQTEIRQDGQTAPLASDFATGGSMGQMAPFDGTLSFPKPTMRYGAVVLLTKSASDGSVQEASVVRVAF